MSSKKGSGLVKKTASGLGSIVYHTNVKGKPSGALGLTGRGIWKLGEGIVWLGYHQNRAGKHGGLIPWTYKAGKKGVDKLVDISVDKKSSDAADIVYGLGSMASWIPASGTLDTLLNGFSGFFGQIGGVNINPWVAGLDVITEAGGKFNPDTQGGLEIKVWEDDDMGDYLAAYTAVTEGNDAVNKSRLENLYKTLNDLLKAATPEERKEMQLNSQLTMLRAVNAVRNQKALPSYDASELDTHQRRQLSAALGALESGYASFREYKLQDSSSGVHAGARLTNFGKTLLLGGMVGYTLAEGGSVVVNTAIGNYPGAAYDLVQAGVGILQTINISGGLMRKTSSDNIWEAIRKGASSLGFGSAISSKINAWYTETLGKIGGWSEYTRKTSLAAAKASIEDASDAAKQEAKLWEERVRDSSGARREAKAEERLRLSELKDEDYRQRLEDRTTRRRVKMERKRYHRRAVAELMEQETGFLSGFKDENTPVFKGILYSLNLFDKDNYAFTRSVYHGIRGRVWPF